MKLTAVFGVLVVALLVSVAAAETFDTAGKMSEEGITFDVKDSLSLSGDYKTKVLVNINKYELAQVKSEGEFTGYGTTEKVPEVEYDLITFPESEDISIGYVGEEGKYVVPAMTFSVMLSPTAELKEIKLKSTKTQEIDITLPKFAPIRVGGESYRVGSGVVEGYYPGEYYNILERSEPTGVKTIVFSLYPLQYDDKSHSGILYYNYEFEIISRDASLKAAYIFCLAALLLIGALIYLILREKGVKISTKK